ncbi:MAG: T9SS type A sorting domain-containing protein [bacterium]|nr:T9SS type A sorting domain-containing protein [bacterium]
MPAATADYLFGCISGPEWDIIPDIAVGRISCRTPQELGTYVGKVLRYETDPDYESMFQSNVLMITDYYDPGPPQILDFPSDYSEPCIRALVESTAVNVTRVYLDSIPAGQGPIRLRDALREGCIAANYNGHGGGGVWSGSSLIDVGGVRLLNNRESFPFITNFTCYVGAFDDRSQASVLGEAFLFTRNNNGSLVGAIGFYSSSGVGWAFAGQTMQRYIYDILLRPPALTIGEASMLNKARWWSDYNNPLGWGSNYSMMMMMNLLGDPGVRLKIPDDQITPRILAETNIIDPIDSLGVVDSVRAVLTLPWAQDSSTNAFTYIIPYNGEVFRELTSGGLDFVSTHTMAMDESRIDFQLCQAQVCTTDAFTVPDLVTTDGDVVVYVTNPSLRRSAVGRFPIYLADSLINVQILDISPVPGPVAFDNQAFRVRATILHQGGIENVRFRGVFTPAQGPVTLDTLRMVEGQTGVFQTVSDLGPYDFEGGTYRLKFFVTPNGGDEWESEYFDLLIEQNPDFNINFLQSSAPGERGGWRPYYLQPISVQRSASQSILDSVYMRLEATRDSSYLVSGDTVTVVVDSFTSDFLFSNLNLGEFERQAWIPVAFRPGKWTISVTADPDDIYPESYETNNARTFQIEMPGYYAASRNVGTFYERPFTPGPHRYWSLTKHDTLEVRILPGVLARDSAAIGYQQPRTITQSELSALAARGLLPPFGQSAHGLFTALFDDSLGSLGGSFSANVTLKLEGRDTLRSRVPFNDYALYVNDPQTGQWVRSRNVQVTRLATDTTRIVPPPANPSLDTLVTWQLNVSGTTPSLGEIGVFRVVDTEGPTVDISVGGLRFTQGAIVPRNPEIFATVRDAAGVQRGDTLFRMILDGDTISPSLIAWNDTSWTANSFTAMLEPDLETGEHTLHVLGTDNHGNVTIYEANFDVRSEFGFEWAINYPNPFARTTTIAYVLTGVTDQFTELKIYTVAGRLIRTLHDNERATANYRTIVWDGRDEHLEEVANGVYFARLTAQQGDQKIEKTVKLAKVRK